MNGHIYGSAEYYKCLLYEIGTGKLALYTCDNNSDKWKYTEVGQDNHVKRKMNTTGMDRNIYVGNENNSRGGGNIVNAHRRFCGETYNNSCVFVGYFFRSVCVCVTLSRRQYVKCMQINSMKTFL